MFNLKYNIINALRVIISALSLFFMLRVFGISQGSDIYLLAVSIIVSWQYIPLLFIGQFIPFYNDEKCISINQAHKFFNQTFLFTLTVGLIFFTLCFLFSEQIIRFYTINLDNERFDLLLKILKIMTFSLIFAPVQTLTTDFFIAEKKFITGYLLIIIEISIPVITMAYMMFYAFADLKLLAFSYSFAVMLSAAFGTFICYGKYISFKFSALDNNFKKFISNSFTMYFGKSIEICLLPMVLNNFLVGFSQGIISCFYYSKNAINSVNMIAADYSNKSITAELSEAIAKKNKDKIIQSIKKYLLIVPFIFLIAAILTYFVLPLCLKIIFYKSSNTFDIKQFTNMFLSLIPWFMISLYALPFSYFNALNKKSFVVIFANSLYIAVTALILYFCTKNIYNVSIALALAQIPLILIHWYFSNKTILKSNQ